MQKTFAGIEIMQTQSGAFCNFLFVDTNLFIRYLTNDDPAKADRVDNLLNQAAVSKIKLVTAEIVLIEVVWGAQILSH